MEENHWLTEACAKAFWDQKEGRPYKQLVDETIGWADPAPGERWLDLGCGSGQLASGLWQRGGPLQELVCLDCASVNAEPIARLDDKHQSNGAIRFMEANFSDGLRTFPAGSFDGVVSGLSISYAEHFDPATGKYTDRAFCQLLADVRRLLRPDGRFVFSINVPNPQFWRVLWKSLGSGLRISRPGRQLVTALRMMRYGHWLRHEAKRGRFHYLPIDQLSAKLQAAGFGSIDHRVSYADQAFVVRARPAAVQKMSA
ncbi:class I SAM-dependent methyltransferase [bacterium]|nr:class I SAM-dependent methyltransferase [bacterium]